MIHGADTYLKTFIDRSLGALEEGEGVLVPVHDDRFRSIVAERDQVATQRDRPERCRCDAADGLEARSAILACDCEDLDALCSTTEMTARPK